MPTTKIIAASATVVVALGLLLGWRLRHKPKPVAAKPVAQVVLAPEITLTGRLQPQTTEQVEVPVAGYLDAWFVEEGQEVYEGQLLGRIRNPDLDKAVQKAQAAVDLAEVHIAQLTAQATGVQLEISRTAADQVRARSELDRIEKIYQRQNNLMEAKAIARLTFERTEADYNAAKTDASRRDASAKEALDKASALERDSEEAKIALASQTAALAQAKEATAAEDLHSLADGVVLTREIREGFPVIVIASDLTNLAVSLIPDASILARIHPGQHAFVRLSETELPAEVHEVRGTEVIVNFTNPTPITKFGAATQVRIVF
jgi:multidrug resistance efflux pump